MKKAYFRLKKGIINKNTGRLISIKSILLKTSKVKARMQSSNAGFRSLSTVQGLMHLHQPFYSGQFCYNDVVSVSELKSRLKVSAVSY